MTIAVRAIETKYKSCRFRSRLEARHAVFFDDLEIQWEYEKEGFQFNRLGSYLPDFWLPDYQCWIEIKGELPTLLERAKAAALARQTQKKVFIFYGTIEARPVESVNESALCFFPDGSDDDQYCWCECLSCDAFGIEFQGRSDRLPCHTKGKCPNTKHGDKGFSLDTPRLLNAYTAARSARFEHGEKGALNGLV